MAHDCMHRLRLRLTILHQCFGEWRVERSFELHFHACMHDPESAILPGFLSLHLHPVCGESGTVICYCNACRCKHGSQARNIMLGLTERVVKASCSKVDSPAGSGRRSSPADVPLFCYCRNVSHVPDVRLSPSLAECAVTGP